MSVMAIGDEELLDYVIEKDMEDAVSRVILGCLREFERGAGRKRLARVLRGKDPGFLLNGREMLRTHFGRLSQLDEDQVLDFIESLTRLGLVEPVPGELPTIRVSEQGERALSSRDQIPAMIPWPLPARDVPIPIDPELYSRLRELGNRLARGEEVPPYCVMPNATLVTIVNFGVTEISDLTGMKGLGKSRIDKYGAALMEALSKA